MLIPGLIRVPLPQADFHNIRHHHGVGEAVHTTTTCLRRYPTASQDTDVAVFALALDHTSDRRDQ